LLGNRNYALFGALFGVRSDLFPALAPDRGLPDDVSDTVRQEALETGDYWGHTWIRWSELQAANPDELGNGLFLYERFLGATGTPIETRRIVSYDPERVNQQWQEGEHHYWTIQPKRRDLIADDLDWQAVFQISAVLAEHFGESAVQLVVWFDS
jgi:hypothetical protein